MFFLLSKNKKRLNLVNRDGLFFVCWYQEVRRMKNKPTYAGSIGLNGSQQVKAPLAPKAKKGPAKVKRGNDLRCKQG